MPSNKTKSKRPVVRRTSPTSCSVSYHPVMWKFIASCVAYFADMKEIGARFEGRKLTPDEQWAVDIARGTAYGITQKTQKPNPSHHAPPLGGGSVHGVVGILNFEKMKT